MPLLYQHASDDAPGMAVGIVQDGQIIYEHYMGYANMEHKVRIDEHTVFNIASNCKQFTALAILKLIDQGKIQLDDDFRNYLPDLYPEVEHKITVAHLLGHTSGVRDVHSLWSLKGENWWKLFVDNGDAMDLLRAQRDLSYKPGTAYMYSNSNYILLAEIVKAVSGQKFSDYSKSMFEELGMPNTHFLTDYMAIIPNKARPYANWGEWKEFPSIAEIHGDGSLYTTLKDQLQWEQIIQKNNGEFISQEIINASQSKLPNAIPESDGYGLFFENRNGLDYTYHDGSQGAYHATFLRFPSKNLAIVVMANSGGVPSNYLAWQIASTLLNLKEEKLSYPAGPQSIAKLKQTGDLLGNYRNDEGTIIRISEKEGSLYREMYRRDPVKLVQEEGALFEYETIPGLKMSFSQIGEKDQQFTLFMSTQRPATYYKISDLHLSNLPEGELNGRFYNDETDTEIVLEHREGSMYALTKNGRERKAELVVKDYLRMMDSYEIMIIRDENNKVVGLNVNNDRMKNVIFDRS